MRWSARKSAAKFHSVNSENGSIVGRMVVQTNFYYLIYNQKKNAYLPVYHIHWMDWEKVLFDHDRYSDIDDENFQHMLKLILLF